MGAPSSQNHDSYEAPVRNRRSATRESNKGDTGAWTAQQTGTECDVTDPLFHSKTAASIRASSTSITDICVMPREVFIVRLLGLGRAGGVVLGRRDPECRSQQNPGAG